MRALFQHSCLGFCAELNRRGHHRKVEDGFWYAHLDEDKQEIDDAQGF